MGEGMLKLCKMYGRVKFGEDYYIWDHVQNKPVKETELTKEQWEASEKAKWQEHQKQMETKTNSDKLL